MLGKRRKTILDSGKGRGPQAHAVLIDVTRQETFMIQTMSHRISMRPAVVAVVTAPAVAAATVAVVAATGSGLHRCEDIPLAQESPRPD
jgi:hypothetical protein